MKRMKSFIIQALMFLISVVSFTIFGQEKETDKNMSEEKFRNKLAEEESPYLLQHADNPVDWYPWGEEAFEKAEKEDKPIFLSIGYSTCHWCHVMEHESFEDPEVAKLMNDTFVSIKVDREERPDIDNIYMTVCQMMTGGGGWPLTVVMTPDKRPFFAGTYFPKESRFGRIGFKDLIKNIDSAWQNKRQQIEESANNITETLEDAVGVTPGGEADKSILDTAFTWFEDRYDKINGGFGSSPKFPTPHNMLFLLRYWNRTGDQKALEMVEHKLIAMRMGGIYDHLGFGFHRYSTDKEWLLPHFEKMLYDQAMLALAYLETYQATGKNEYKQTAEEIFTYVLRDMTDKSGGFYSAEDADSEGEEGKFYVWEKKEIIDILGEEDGNVFCKVFNVTDDGNFMEEASGERKTTNILHLRTSYSSMADKLGLSEDELINKIEESRKKLFEAREKRVHPFKDDKILTDWNGLMITAFAKGAKVLNSEEYLSAADNAVNFVLKNMTDEKGRLYHRFRNGDAGIDAKIDDYAFLIWGLIELYEANFNPTYLQRALELNNILTEHFWDEERGAYFFTSDFGEKLLVRQKDILDSAIPSGNSVQMLNLLRLGRITANTKLEEMANKLMEAFTGQINKMPSAFTQLLSAYDFGLGPSYEVVIVGDSGDNLTKEFTNKLFSNYIPNKIVIVVSSDNKEETTKIAGYISDYEMINSEPTVFVCQNYVCNLPTNDPGKMLELLNKK
jgi:uncharacterized protein YyaL (SSP411 family)